MGVFCSERDGNVILVMLLMNPIELLEVKGSMGQEEEEVFDDHEEEYLPNVCKDT